MTTPTDPSPVPADRVSAAAAPGEPRPADPETVVADAATNDSAAAPETTGTVDPAQVDPGEDVPRLCGPRETTKGLPVQVIVVSGPTAVGKGTVVGRLRELHPEVFVSISATTRGRRPGEIDGVHYHFVDDPQFDHLVQTGGLLEWAWVHGSARYGTPREPVEEAVEQGRPVVLEIDMQGAEQVKRNYPAALQVFLEPPNWAELVRRLVGRGTETIEQQRRRLITARDELAHEGDFDTVVVNGEIDQTVARLVRLLGL